MRSLPALLALLALPVLAFGPWPGSAPSAGSTSPGSPAPTRGGGTYAPDRAAGLDGGAGADDGEGSGAGGGLTQEGLEEMSQTVRLDVEELRGVEFLRDVEVVLTDLDGFRAYVERRIESLQSPEDLRADELAAKLLGMVPPEMDLMEVTQELLDEQVGGFYDPEGEAFYLLDHFDEELAGVFLAHELTHALDDQLYDIDGTLHARDGNGDAQAAYHAVVEGSGTSIMNLWVVGHMTRSLMEALQSLEMVTPGMSEAPPYVWKPMLASYMRGAAFLVRSDNVLTGQMKRADADDLDLAFREPPLSTEQVLHPEKYWNAELRDDPLPLDFELGELPAGWKVLREETLGELGLALVTWPLDDRAGLSASNPEATLRIRYTHAPSEGWGGDRLILLEREGALFLRLATVWDTVEDAKEFSAAMNAETERLSEIAKRLGEGGQHSGASVVAQTDERRVTITIASGIDVLELPALDDALRVQLTLPEDVPGDVPGDEAR